MLEMDLTLPPDGALDMLGGCRCPLPSLSSTFMFGLAPSSPMLLDRSGLARPKLNHLREDDVAEVRETLSGSGEPVWEMAGDTAVLMEARAGEVVVELEVVDGSGGERVGRPLVAVGRRGSMVRELAPELRRPSSLALRPVRRRRSRSRERASISVRSRVTSSSALALFLRSSATCTQGVGELRAGDGE